MNLSEYIKQIRGVSYKPNDVLSISTDGYIPLLRANNINDGKINFDNLVYVKAEKVKENQILKKGDILVCASSGSRDLVGKAATFDNDLRCTFGAFCKVIRANNINEKYLSVFFQSEYYRKNISQNSRGANINNLKQEDFDNLLINIPSVVEQEKIAVKIKKIMDLIYNKKIQIELMNQLIKSQFVEMFNDKSFDIFELNELCDVRDGTHDSPKYLDCSEYKFITSKNIVGDSIDFSDCKYISENDYNKFNQRSKVNNGDILMPMIGTIGNPIIVDVPEDEIDFAIKNVALIKFNENSKVINIYIKSLLNSDYFESEISQNKRGGTQKFIALSDIRKIKVPVPPIELQNKFAQIVEQIDKQKFEFENSLKKLEELQASLMQEYFG